MRDERWAVVWELFNSAHDMPPGRRSALLECDSLDPEIRDEVLALLEVSSSCTIQRSFPGPPAAGPEYPVGYQFGRYMIVGLIGQGGFGRIYAAHDRELRRVVALKVLAGAWVSDRDGLIEEARAASALNHPNIVTVYETISADDHLAIVMEFVDGRSLRQVLHATAGPLPINRVLRYGRQLAEALESAHQAGITHRDVKPENILVRKDEYIKLVDFGLATSVIVTPARTGTGAFAGTLRYVSPEQLRGEPSSPACDVFSLGLVLYEMTTGVHAFPGTTPLEAAEAIATAQPVPPSRKAPQIPPDFDRLIITMLAKDPATRPDAAAVVRLLGEIAGGSGRRLSWRRLWAAAAIAVAAVGASAVIIPQWMRKPPVTLRLDSRPLTGEAGRETQPALSPDGRFVVYSWQEKANRKPVTIVREIGSSRKTVLPISGPYSWLPDNQHIGFIRHGEIQDTLCSIFLDGSGMGEVLKATHIHSFEWSPDGASIVYAAAAGEQTIPAIFLYSTKHRENRQITFPPSNSRGDTDPAISPNGRRLAFRRNFNPGNSDVFLTSLFPLGQVRQVTFRQLDGYTVAWVRDGTAIITAAFRGGNTSLWLHPLDSPQKPSRLTEVGIEASNIRSAIQRNRLVWVNSQDDTNIWSVPVTGGKPVRVISSAMGDLDVASSSSGLLAFRSDRSGFPEIWISAKDGRSEKKVTSLENFTGSPKWSPDGRRLVFDSRRPNAATHIYVMDCDAVRIECGSPMQVTDHQASDALPNWSADGSQIYFSSQRSGDWQVWKIPARGNHKAAVQVTTHGGYFSAESADAKWLYYSRVDSKQLMGLWRKRLASDRTAPFHADDPGEMILPMEYRSTATWILSGRNIFYVTPGGSANPAAVWAFDLETRRKRMVYTNTEIPLARGIALAPGGDSLYFAQFDRWQSNVVVADYEAVK